MDCIHNQIMIVAFVLMGRMMAIDPQVVIDGDHQQCFSGSASCGSQQSITSFAADTDYALMQTKSQLLRDGNDDRDGLSKQSLLSTTSVECEDPEGEGKDCSKKVKVEIPPFEIPIPCCKGCPCSTTVPPLTIVKNFMPPANFGMCAMQGDPHIWTFDGARVGAQDPDGTFWLVHSEKVQIQAAWKAKGRITKVGFSGDWMKGHKLIIAGTHENKGWYGEFDGKRVLEKSGETFKRDGLCEVSRLSPKDLQLTDEQLKELDAGHDDGWWKGKVESIMKGKAWKGGFFYLKLPNLVEVFIGHGDATEMIIRMQAQPDQGGYCGNFNGDPNDDTTDGKGGRTGAKAWYRNESPAKGTMLDKVKDPIVKTSLIEEEEGEAPAESMMQEDSQNSKHKDCPKKLMKKATEACKHIPEKGLQMDCIFDICMTEDVELANDAVLFEVMKMKEAQGVVEFQGKGRCVDVKGKGYSSIKASGIEDRQKCLELMSQVKDTKLLSKLRGAQFTEGSDGGCFFLVEAGTDSKKFMADVPGLWGEESSKPGKGIISSTDSEEGSYCWQFIN